MFETIKIENFRGMKELEIIGLKQFNLLVGKNESGKTSILEALFLLVNPANSLLVHRINLFRNLKKIDSTILEVLFYKEIFNKGIRLKAELNDPRETRELIITPIKNNRIVRIENTNKEIKKDKYYYSTEDSSEDMSKITGIEMLYNYFSNDCHKEFFSKIILEGANLTFKNDKEYKEKWNGIFICEGTIFDNLINSLNELQISKKMNRVIQILKKIEPSIKSLEIGAENVIYCDIGLRRLVPINILGMGLIKILHIISSIISRKNGIVFIDEIENGLYYQSQKILWDAIFETSLDYNVQIIATTHSIECLRAYSMQYNKYIRNKDNLRLFRIEKENDKIDVATYNYNKLISSIDMQWEVR